MASYAESSVAGAAAGPIARPESTPVQYHEHGMDPASFNDPLEQEFLMWMRHPLRPMNRARLSYIERRETMAYLQDPDRRSVTQEEHNLKHRAKKLYFINTDDQLWRKAQGDVPDTQVVLEEAVFTKIKRVHERLLHTGRDKTWKEVKKLYHGINKEEVSWVISNCRHCQENAPGNIRPPLTTIHASSPLERVQIDLIDMRGEPSGEFKWILHMKDHFSKFSYLWPLLNKKAVSVADALVPILMILQPPKIMQCDNGGEFKGALLILLRRHGIRIINGNPRHPQTQGLVEKANGTAKSRVKAWMKENNSQEWANGLLEIAWSINSTSSEAHGLRPYQVMFGGRNPHVNDDNWLSSEERQTATIMNEDRQPPEDEDSINWQLRVEQTNVRPGGRVRPLPDPLRRLQRIAFNTPAQVQKEVEAIVANDDETIANDDETIANDDETSPLHGKDKGKAKFPVSAAEVHDLAGDLTFLGDNELQNWQRRRGIPTINQPPEGPVATEFLLMDLDESESGVDYMPDSESESTSESDLASERQITPAGSGDESESARSPSPSTSNSDPSNSRSRSLSVDSVLSGTPPLDDGLAADPTQRQQRLKAYDLNIFPNGIDPTTQQAREALSKTRKKMRRRYNKEKKVQVFSNGALVTIKVPSIDRAAASDPLRIYARVVAQPKRHLYKLQTDHGVINRLYAARDLQLVPPGLANTIRIAENPDPLSLRAIVCKVSTAQMVRVSCKCNKFPCSKRCNCMKVGVKCSIYCHGKDRDCQNLAEGGAFNEYGLIDRKRGGLRSGEHMDLE